MKPLTFKIFGAALAIALAGAALAAVVWVAATTQGARWLLTSAALPGGIGISAQKIEGSINGHLLLSGVRINLAQQKIELDSLELRWKPLLLLAGTIAVQELTLNTIRIQDDTPLDNKPPVLSWPRVSERGQLFDGRISRLQLTDLNYRRLREPALTVESAAAELTWRNGLLSLTDLKLVSPAGQINGAVSAGFKHPSLTADLVMALTHPVAEMDRFSVQAGKSKGAGHETFAGNITVTGSTGSRKRLELNGDLGMAGSAINLRRLRLTRPGRKGLLTGDGSLAITAGESVLSLQVKVAGLDLAPELNVPTDLSGSLRFAGTPDNYRGDFKLANQAHGWQAATVSASYQGTRAGMKLAPLNASLLDGSMAGNLNIDWRDGVALQAALSGRNLNPARLDPGWQGVANFSATGKLAWSGKVPLTGSISGALLESRLHGQALTGGLQADFVGDNLSLTRLMLRGKGFDLHASGELKQRITLAAHISDFSRLVPGSAGTLRAEGWMRWRDGQPTGALAGTGSMLAWAGTRIAAANLTARLDQGAGYPLHLTAALRDVVYDAYRLNDVTLEADGTLAAHRVKANLRSAGSEARLTLSAGYNAGIWKGELTRLAGRDGNGPWNLTAPASFSVGSGTFSLSPLALGAGADEHLEISADLTLNPLGGQVQSHWTGLKLTRANSWLKDMQITGISSGTVRTRFQSGTMLTMAGSAAGSGTFTGQGRSMALKQYQITFDGNEQGMRIGSDLTTADGGRLKGAFSSSAPLRRGIPDQGQLTADLSDIDLVLLKPWLPTDTGLEGRVSGQATGSMLPGKRFDLDGTARLSGGKLHQHRPDGELTITFASATASWSWREDSLAGNLSLAMAEYGQVRGSFQLPIPARFPVAVNPKGALRATLSAQVREKGIITALFPGLVQESFGELDAELALSGTWETPQAGGKLNLARAGAYLPTAGIHLKEIQVAARLEKDLIRIDSFRAVSGPGHIRGTALITLSGWQVTGYQGTINGENFQTVSFPELRILSSPQLRFEGTPQKLTLRGELHLPELNIVGAQSRTVIAPSSDVIREGRVAPPAAVSPLALDIQVRALLGEKVFVKVAGIDARLGGAIDLSLSSFDRITSKGEIKVVKGRYRTYGVNLEIVRGRLFFAGGPVASPTIDFLALRTIGSVRAGVTVAGTLLKPVTKLYSEPAMPDVDILAYIVLGHPLGSSSQQASLLTQAAGALLTSGQAALVQDQIKNYLGLSTLEIQGGVGGSTSPMGYKPLQVTPPGTIAAAQQPGITETVLTVGKYVTPELYISYGKSLFTGSHLFRLRYDIFKRWQIETQTGSESGVDLYYKMEFK